MFKESYVFRIPKIKLYERSFSIKPRKKNKFNLSFMSILLKRWKTFGRSRRLNKFSNVHYLEILPLKSLMHEFINIASSFTQVGGWTYLPIFSKLHATRGKLNFWFTKRTSVLIDNNSLSFSFPWSLSSDSRSQSVWTPMQGRARWFGVWLWQGVQRYPLPPGCLSGRQVLGR